MVSGHVIQSVLNTNFEYPKGANLKEIDISLHSLKSTCNCVWAKILEWKSACGSEWVIER